METHSTRTTKEKKSKDVRSRTQIIWPSLSLFDFLAVMEQTTVPIRKTTYFLAPLLGGIESRRVVQGRRENLVGNQKRKECVVAVLRYGFKYLQMTWTSHGRKYQTFAIFEIFPRTVVGTWHQEKWKTREMIWQYSVVSLLRTMCASWPIY